MNLEGKRALITGGSSGIGLAIAGALVERRARVAVNGRSAERLAEATAKLGCDSIAGDVGVEADAVRIVATFVEQHGGIDILVNNAGFGLFAPLVATQTPDFEAVLRTNVGGSFLMAREAARHMIEQGGGAIVNVASTAALRGFQGGTAYAASKFALRGMSECWREELRRHDIRVMLVNPSEVLTAFARHAGREQEAHPKKLHPEEIAHAVVAMLEMDERGFIPELSIFATNPF